MARRQRVISIPRRINPGDPEAIGLKACYVAQPGGMLDLVTGTVGTRSGTADPMRSNEEGTLDAYYDGVSDSDGFGTASLIVTTAPFTLVWEGRLDAFVDGFPTPMEVMTAADGAYRIHYSNDTSYDDITFGTTSAGWARFFVSLSGIASVTAERHWGVLTYDGVSPTTASSFKCYVNGRDTGTPASTPGYGGVTAENRVGGTSATSTDWNGSIRQARVYDRVWSHAEVVRFWHPSSRDSLYAPPRRRTYFGVTAGGAPSIVGPLIGSSHLLTNGPLISGRLAA